MIYVYAAVICHTLNSALNYTVPYHITPTWRGNVFVEVWDVTDSSEYIFRVEGEANIEGNKQSKITAC